ncbi:hypothetical protein Scep_008565 [Stephania cephalantha]|uniref:non-specific serine/threonine protein kinase n=1 Tax=Stephania cephalantha TaxID=152367 RepID=A0AAP0KDP9_9MAGN
MKVVGKEKVIEVGMTEHVKREISVMKMVKHPNIVELHEVMASKSKIYFAMEYVKGGELFNKISKGRLQETTARFYFQQLISAIDFCHSRCVYHRDLKPENLLLDEKGNLKVTDFGLSAFADHLKQDGFFTLPGFLPFQDDNLVAMYKKIYKGDFKCPPWFSSESRRIVTKLLDPNPSTRITIAKLMETPWFKKSLQRNRLRRTKEEELEFYSNNGDDDDEVLRDGKEKETLNAFHIISLSQGFDLSPLFEERKGSKDEEMRFATTTPASGVMSKLEEAARGSKVMKFDVKKRGECAVRMMGQERGRKGKLVVAAQIYAIAPAFSVVEVNKEGGDTLEYNQFCSEELRPALKDIAWTSCSSTQTTAAAAAPPPPSSTATV